MAHRLGPDPPSRGERAGVSQRVVDWIFFLISMAMAGMGLNWLVHALVRCP